MFSREEGKKNFGGVPGAKGREEGLYCNVLALTGKTPKSVIMCRIFVGERRKRGNAGKGHLAGGVNNMRNGRLFF